MATIPRLSVRIVIQAHSCCRLRADCNFAEFMTMLTSAWGEPPRIVGPSPPVIGAARAVLRPVPDVFELVLRRGLSQKVVVGSRLAPRWRRPLSGLSPVIYYSSIWHRGGADKCLGFLSSPMSFR